jgi:hypothetical protein
MKTSELLLSILDITEDEYSYKGQFTLSTPEKSKTVDIMDLERDSSVKELISFFNLEDEPPEIRKTLMNMVMEKAYISSLIVEGDQQS